MKKQWIAFVVLAFLGLALANGDGGQVWEINDSGSDSVSVSEKIQVTIPVRYALHLTESLWQLDLNSPTAAPASYVYDPDEKPIPAEGCYLVPKSVKSMDDLRTYALGGNEFKPIDTYPAIKDYDGNGEISDSEKGTIICVNHKILQKFSNDPDGWKLLVSVTGPTTGFGYFGMADVLPFGPGGYFYTDTMPVSNQQLACGDGPTQGWLDDLIVEGFWFDGSEAAGTHNFTVTFTLMGM